MTATAAQPAAEANRMAHTPDPQPDPASTAAGAAPRRRAVLGDALLPTLLATAVVGLLIFSLASDRSRTDRLEDTVNAQFAATDARIDELDTKIDRIDLKLTALIATLNKTGEVEAALEGKFLDAEPTP